MSSSQDEQHVGMRQTTLLELHRHHVRHDSAENLLVDNDVNHVVQFQTKHTRDNVRTVVRRLTVDRPPRSTTFRLYAGPAAEERG